MALGAGKPFVRRLNQVGRLYEQRSISSSPGLLLQVGIVVAGQALLRSRGRLRGNRKGIRNSSEEKPGKEKASDHLSAAYAPHYQARNGIATHIPKEGVR